jgi:hypothetical protein
LLALFAMAMQIGLSFGHFHHDRAFAAKAAASAQASLSSDQQGSDTDGADLCSICATIALANTLIDSTAPALPILVETAATELFPLLRNGGFGAQPLGFQSRAPPRS